VTIGVVKASLYSVFNSDALPEIYNED